MFVIGLALGVVLLVVGERRADPRRIADPRRRSMSADEVLGYRAALGENPATMPVRGR